MKINFTSFFKITMHSFNHLYDNLSPVNKKIINVVELFFVAGIPLFCIYLLESALSRGRKFRLIETRKDEIFIKKITDERERLEKIEKERMQQETKDREEQGEYRTLLSETFGEMKEQKTLLYNQTIKRIAISKGNLPKELQEKIPPFVLEKILNYLPLSAKIKTRLVCKRFNHIICSCPFSKISIEKTRIFMNELIFHPFHNVLRELDKFDSDFDWKNYPYSVISVWFNDIGRIIVLVSEKSEIFGLVKAEQSVHLKHLDKADLFQSLPRDKTGLFNKKYKIETITRYIGHGPDLVLLIDDKLNQPRTKKKDENKVLCSSMLSGSEHKKYIIKRVVKELCLDQRQFEISVRNHAIPNAEFGQSIATKVSVVIDEKF